MIIVDEITGEKIGDYKPKKRIRKKNHYYYIIWYDTIINFNVNVTPGMIGLIGEMDLNNRLEIQSKLMRKLAIDYNMNYNTIKTNLRRLVRKLCAIKLGKNLYFINPYFFTKCNQYKADNLQNEFGKLLLNEFMSAKDEKKKNKIASDLRNLDPVWEANLILQKSRPFE